MILDGYGMSEARAGNAVAAANTPNLDRLFAECPHTQLGASGMDVGLPEGQMGNSEVGHTNIGAGRVVYQELTRISKAIRDGNFFQNDVLAKAMRNCIENDTSLHLMGLCSDGGVHSHLEHLYGLLEMAKRNGVSKVYIHCFMDGRDVAPTSGAGFIAELQKKCKEIATGKIATVMGRFYAMDRDNRWERVERAYNAMTQGEGKLCEDAVLAVNESYNNNVTDEFIEPVVCCADGKISAGDSVVFFNFRPDRAREITRAFVDGNFAGFERKNGYIPLEFVCMTQYDASMPNVQVAFKPQVITNTLGQIISDSGKKQLRIAETEKYAHVTFFFNGGVEAVSAGEDRILIKSPQVKTYDMQPQMSAPEVTQAVVQAIEQGIYDLIVLNYANCDMVGHTGDFNAAVKAVQAVDKAVGAVAEAVKKANGIMLITADHGNADQMLEADNSPMTAHTTNPVPFLVMGKDVSLKEGGKLADIAPTILQLMGLNQPKEMDGISLLK